MSGHTVLLLLLPSVWWLLTWWERDTAWNQVQVHLFFFVSLSHWNCAVVQYILVYVYILFSLCVHFLWISYARAMFLFNYTACRIKFKWKLVFLLNAIQTWHIQLHLFNFNFNKCNTTDGIVLLRLKRKCIFLNCVISHSSVFLSVWSRKANYSI